MCGSRPEPEVVTKSIGTGLPGFSACNFSTSAFTRSISFWFIGPRFDPDDELASYAAADGLPRKYPGDENGWPSKRDPMIVPSALLINCPFAWSGKITCARPVTTSG